MDKEWPHTGVYPKKTRHVENESLVALEFGAHYMKVRQLAHVFGHEEIEFHFRKIEDLSESLGVTFQNPRHRFIATHLTKRSGKVLPSLHFYAKAFRSVSRARFLWVLTAPEQRVLADIIFFSIAIAVLKPRLVISIGALERWSLTGQDGLRDYVFRFLRHWALGRAEYLTFETETQHRTFKENFPYVSARTTVFPTSSSDEGMFLRNANLPKKSPQEARIGLLGGVSEERRDYHVLRESLQLLPTDIVSRITLVVLGHLLDPGAEKVLSQLREIVTVEVEAPFLSHSDFVRIGLSCEALVSPFLPGRGYGVSHGSGSFGDAILLNRALIIPRFSDPTGEFQKFSHYYSSASDLANVLEDLVKSAKLVATPDSFEEWAGSSIRERMCQDFGWNFP